MNSHYNPPKEQTLAKIGHTILTPDQCIKTLLSGAANTKQATVNWHDPHQAQDHQSKVTYRREAAERTGSDLTHDTLDALIDGVTIPLNKPVLLQRTAIPKPWGQELWYTGMEARGHSQIAVNANTLPLAQYLALAPEHLSASQTPVLLKILDPNPQDHLGDLYFELHQQKQEVYVVTHVDAQAWPNGVGAIRLGIDPKVRAAYADDAKLRADYLAAVQAYEEIRRAIDTSTKSAPDAKLIQQEQQRRQTMEAFIALQPLRVGDVVTVDPWYPHSLQHGVRVVELQTPTYERLIISFAQPVLTQDHWDSAEAVANMSLESPPSQPTTQANNQQRLIADYSDFKAWLVTLQPEERLRIPNQSAYALAIAISGTPHVGSLSLAPEQASFIPSLALPCEIANPGAQPAQLILGGPPNLQLTGAQ